MTGEDSGPKKEYLSFLSRLELELALKTHKDIKIESSAKGIIDATKSPNDIFAIYYTNPDIRIIRAELITKERFIEYLSP